MSFGEELRRNRRERGFSQQELAQRAGTSKQVISRYERGERIPRLSDAQRLADAMGVTVEELSGSRAVYSPSATLTDIAGKYSLTADETELLTAFFLLEPSERARVFRMLRGYLDRD